MVAAAKAVPDPAAPATPPAEPAPLAGDSPQSLNEEIENNVAQPLMPSLSVLNKPAKGKGKSKSKGKKKGRKWSAGALDCKQARRAEGASRDAAQSAEVEGSTHE
eukprot:5601227-Amphidinium_carterae.1